MVWGIVISFLLISHPTPTIRMAKVPTALAQSRRSARILAQSKQSLSIESDAAREPSAKRSKRLRGIPSSVSRMSSSAAAAVAAQPNVSNNVMPPLINLGKLLRGTLVKRPSATIKSPYVADVSLSQGKKEKQAPASSTVLAHAPSLDVGGMCVPGSEVYLSKRNGEGKTSHSIELVHGAPSSFVLVNPTSSLVDTTSGNGVLVGAHPRLGELIAEEVLQQGLLKTALILKNGFVIGPVNDYDDAKKLSGSPRKPRATKKKHGTNNNDLDIQTSIAGAQSTSHETKVSLRRQVTFGDSRVDFQMTLTNPVDNTCHCVLFEVKNVVCADYEAGTEPEKNGPGHCVVVAPATSANTDSNGENNGYQRAALFPWGKTRGQKFEGKTVVSERACKHLRNLQSQLNEDVTPVVLFIVNRSDCKSVRACREKCPVFAEVLEEVVRSGVKTLAVRVRWTEEGECFFDGVVPVNV